MSQINRSTNSLPTQGQSPAHKQTHKPTPKPSTPSTDTSVNPSSAPQAQESELPVDSRIDVQTRLLSQPRSAKSDVTLAVELVADDIPKTDLEKATEAARSLGLDMLADGLSDIKVRNVPEINKIVQNLLMLAGEDNSVSTRTSAALKLLANLRTIHDNANKPGSQQLDYQRISGLLKTDQVGGAIQKLSTRAAKGIENPGLRQSLKAVSALIEDYATTNSKADDLRKLADVIDGKEEFGNEHGVLVAKILITQYDKIDEIVSGLNQALPPKAQEKVEQIKQRVQRTAAAGGLKALRGLISNTKGRQVLESIIKLSDPKISGPQIIDELAKLGKSLTNSGGALRHLSEFVGGVPFEKLAKAFDPEQAPESRLKALEDVVKQAKTKWSTLAEQNPLQALRSQAEGWITKADSLRAPSVTPEVPTRAATETGEKVGQLRRIADNLGLNTQDISRLEALKGRLGSRFDDAIRFIESGGQKLRGDAARVALELIDSVAARSETVLDAVLKSGMAEQLGNAVGALKGQLSRMGIQDISRHIPKIAKGAGRMIPAVGAIFSGADTLRMGRIALSGKDGDRVYEDPNVRALALLGTGMGAADTALAVAEAFGIGLLGTAANVGLAVGSIAVDIAVDYYDTHPMPEAMAQGIRRGSAILSLGSNIDISGVGLGAQLNKIYGPGVLQQELVAMGSEASEAIKDAIKTGGEEAQKAYHVLKEKAEDGAQWAQNQLLDLSKGAGNIASEARADVENLLSKGGRSAERLVTRIGKNFNSGSRAVRAWSANLLSEAMKVDNLAHHTADLLARKGAAGFSLIAQGIENGAGKAKQQLKNMLGMGLRNNFNDAVGAVQSLGETGVTMLKETARNVSNLAGRAVRALGDMTQVSIQELKNMALTVGSAAEAAMDEIVERAKKQGTAAIAALQDIGSRSSALASSAIENLQEIGGRSSRAVQNAITAVGKTSQRAARSAINALKDFGSSSTQAIRTLGRSVTGAGQHAVNALSQLANQGVGEAKTALRGLANDWHKASGSVRQQGASYLRSAQRQFASTSVGRSLSGWLNSF